MRCLKMYLEGLQSVSCVASSCIGRVERVGRDSIVVWLRLFYNFLCRHTDPFVRVRQDGQKLVSVAHSSSFTHTLCVSQELLSN